MSTQFERNIPLSVITRIVVCSLLLLGAIGFYAAMVRSRPTPATTAAGGAARRLLVMEARPVPVRRHWSGFGTAAAMDRAEIPARVTSVVMEVPPDIVAGAAVSQGDLIARLDDSDFTRQVSVSAQTIVDIDSQLARIAIEEEGWQSRMELADEDVALAQAELDRVKLAAEGGAVKQREIDRARQALVDATRDQVATRETFDSLVPQRDGLAARRAREESLLELASLSVERCSITSPLGGVLEAVHVEVGENLAAGSPVAHVVSLARIEVPIRLSASARSIITVGDEARLAAPGPAAEEWIGQVDRIAPTDDDLSRTFAVFVEVQQDPSAASLLVPGRFVEGEVGSRFAQERSIVPRRALQGEQITLISDGRAVTRAVTIEYFLHGVFPELGLDDTSWAVLASEIPAGSLVVVDAAAEVSEGTPVEPIRASAASDHAPDAAISRDEPAPGAGVMP